MKRERGRERKEGGWIGGIERRKGEGAVSFYLLVWGVV